MRANLVQTSLAIAAIAFSSGCSLIVRNISTETQESARRAASYDGDDCDRVLYDLSQHNDNDYNHDDRKFPQHESDDPAENILLLTCERRQKTGVYGHTIKQWPKVKELNEEKVYFSLDDRKLDTVMMAASVISIMDDDFDRWRRGNLEHQKKTRGLVLFYAEIIDRDKLAAKVAKVGLPADANKAFLTLYDDAVRRARGTQLSAGEMTMYVEVPVATYKARKAHFKEFAPLYSQLTELTSGAKAARSDPSAADDMIAKLSALRGEFLAQCGKPECRSLPLWANATKELALLQVARGNKLDAKVESAMNARPGSYVAGFAQAIRAAQLAEGKKQDEAYSKYKKAKASGVDDETALQIAGGSPGFDFSDSMLFQPKMALPNYAEALSERSSSYDYPRDTEVAVASVQPAGAKARVVFEKETFKSEEAYNCRQTNRVTRIQADGTLEYEEICSYRPSSNTVEKHAPVNIPASEAKLLRKGDSLRFLASGEEARVVEVKRDGKVIQIRGDAVGGKK